MVDASVLANVVGDDGHSGRVARDRVALNVQWSAPDLVDVETVSVLRRRWQAGDLSTKRFRSAVIDLAALPITRYPTGPLMLRSYDLRSKVTPYDATYVALAEGLSCPLVTADARMARAPSIHCTIEVLTV